MSVLSIMEPALVTDIGGTLEGVGRLASPAPKEAATAAAGGDRTIDIDFGTAVSVDTIFLGFVSGAAGVQFAATGGATYDATALGTLVEAPSRLGASRRHYLLALPAVVELRYLRLAAAALPAGASIGVFAAGTAIRPQWGHEYGGGRFVVDTGTVTRLTGGGFGISRGARAGGWQWTLGDLSDDEADALYGMQLGVGETSSVLVVEDPDLTAGLNERIHWGLLSRLEAYERRDSGMTKWALRVEEWA